MKKIIALICIGIFSIIYQKYLIIQYQPTLESYGKFETVKGAFKTVTAGRFHYSAIGRKGFACAVFFDGAGANCRIPNLIENEVVEVKLAKIKTLIGDISYLLSMSANGQIIYEKTPSEALQEWKDGSNESIYVNSFYLMVTIAFFGSLIVRIFNRD
ncbi:hypothetical protein ACO0K2_12180 [Undibacterium sp. MH2W]|uniref:hypothetical protein n=1 Tax=Undibacterium sp. MH2W TaxID=3413044 RepID=UPI003BF23D95